MFHTDRHRLHPAVTAHSIMRTAWQISSKTIQLLCVLAGGALAALLGVRTALFIAGVVCTFSVVLLPYRSLHPVTSVLTVATES